MFEVEIYNETSNLTTTLKWSGPRQRIWCVASNHRDAVIVQSVNQCGRRLQIPCCYFPPCGFTSLGLKGPCELHTALDVFIISSDAVCSKRDVMLLHLCMRLYTFIFRVPRSRTPPPPPSSVQGIQGEGTAELLGDSTWGGEMSIDFRMRLHIVTHVVIQAASSSGFRCTTWKVPSPLRIARHCSLRRAGSAGYVSKCSIKLNTFNKNEKQVKEVTFCIFK